MTEEAKQVKKKCILAKLSLFSFVGFLVSTILGPIYHEYPLNKNVALLLSFLTPILLAFSFVLAVFSLVRIKRNSELLVGTKTAISVIVLSLLFFALFLQSQRGL